MLNNVTTALISFIQPNLRHPLLGGVRCRLRIVKRPRESQQLDDRLALTAVRWVATAQVASHLTFVLATGSKVQYGVHRKISYFRRHRVVAFLLGIVRRRWHLNTHENPRQANVVLQYMLSITPLCTGAF